MIDGIELKPTGPSKQWRFEGIFSGPGEYQIGLPDPQGIVEVTYPDGVTTLVQGRTSEEGLHP